MHSEILLLLRHEDHEILKIYREKPSVAVFVAMQERIWKLYLDRSSDLSKFTSAVTLRRVDTLPEEFQGLQVMLKQFCLNLYTKSTRVKELERKREVKVLGRDKPLRSLLEHLAQKKKFSREDVQFHLEHRYHLYVFDRCVEEGYIYKQSYKPNEDDPDMYYLTYKAKALISDWMKYDPNERSY